MQFLRVFLLLYDPAEATGQRAPPISGWAGKPHTSPMTTAAGVRLAYPCAAGAVAFQTARKDNSGAIYSAQLGGQHLDIGCGGICAYIYVSTSPLLLWSMCSQITTTRPAPAGGKEGTAVIRGWFFLHMLVGLVFLCHGPQHLDMLLRRYLRMYICIYLHRRCSLLCSQITTTMTPRVHCSVWKPGTARGESRRRLCDTMHSCPIQCT